MLFSKPLLTFIKIKNCVSIGHFVWRPNCMTHRTEKFWTNVICVKVKIILYYVLLLHNEPFLISEHRTYMALYWTTELHGTGFVLAVSSWYCSRYGCKNMYSTVVTCYGMTFMPSLIKIELLVQNISGKNIQSLHSQKPIQYKNWDSLSFPVSYIGFNYFIFLLY
jgi:hypothetical protein